MQHREVRLEWQRAATIQQIANAPLGSASSVDWVAKALENRMPTVFRLDAPYDGGLDILAWGISKRIYVQVKDWAAVLHPCHVLRAWTDLQTNYSIDAARDEIWLLNRSGFSPGCRPLAQVLGVKLLKTQDVLFRLLPTELPSRPARTRHNKTRAAWQLAGRRVK